MASRTVVKVVRTVLSLALLGGLVALFVAASLPKPVPVDVAAVATATIRVTIDEDGRTRVKDRYTVSAPLLGNLARIELAAGDGVAEGQVVARIVPLPAPLLDPRAKAEAEARVAASSASVRQAEAAVTRARTAREFADSELQRQKALFEKGSITRQALDASAVEAKARGEDQTSAEFGVRVASHELGVARAALGRLRGDAAEKVDSLEVRSPVAGRVLKVLRESEGVVQPGTPLLEVGEPSALEIVVDVLTTDAVKLAPGAAATIDGWGGEPLAGHLRLIEPSAFTRPSALGVEEQRVNVIVDLAAPHERWQALGDGYRVDAHITALEVADVVAVPASALFRRGDRWAVFRVVEGKASLATLTVGARGEALVEVREGLAAGDQVITYPSDALTEGTLVAPR